MGLYQHVRQTWKRPKAGLGSLWRHRLVEWRRQESTVRIKRPTRLDRARSLGYKAKQGFVLVRQRLPRGGKQRQTIKHGRRSKSAGRRKTLEKSYQRIAEERAVRKYPNCEVLNSYYVAQDGSYYWYEVIMLDRAHPQIVKDKNLGWAAQRNKRGRVFRGLTSSGKKSRGLRKKGKGAEKLRPSRTAVVRKKSK